MLRALGSLPFVVVATARMGQDFRWRPTGRHNSVVLNLDPLDRVAARQLLDSVAESRLPRRVADQLLDRSGGNPFFLEELASLVCDTADPADGLPDLPDNIRGLVAARLDTLTPEERATLEDAAVLGGSGPVTALYTLSASRVPADAPAKFDGDGREAIEGLVAKDMLFLESDRWTFRSESVREVAYNTLTKASRARRHAAIAELFIADEAMGKGERLEQVAMHLAAASEIVQRARPPTRGARRCAGSGRRMVGEGGQARVFARHGGHRTPSQRSSAVVPRPRRRRDGRVSTAPAHVARVGPVGTPRPPGRSHGRHGSAVRR